MGVARSTGRRRAVAAGLWLAAAALLLPRAASVEDRLLVQARILGSESSQAEQALEQRFASPFAVTALVVLGGVPGPDRPEGRAALEQAVAGLRAARGVRQTLSYLDRPDPLFLGHGGGTFVVVGLDPGERVDRLVPALRRVTRSLEERLRAATPGASLRLTGEGPINYDIWRTSADDVARAERRTLPVTLALLVAAFGALVAALLPVVSGVLAVSLSLGLVAVVAERLPLSILAVNVTSMLGLALGIDYALLAVSRFREARGLGQDPQAAAGAAARRAGATIALSGVPVAIGFLALLVVPLVELRSAAVGGLLVTAVSVLLAATLLPALLGWLGPRLEAGRLFRRDAAAERGRYARLAAFVVRRPALVLALALPPLLLLAAESRRLSSSIPRGSWLPAATESARAEADLAAMGRRGVLYTLRAVVFLPEDVQALSREGWDAGRRLAEAFAADPRVAAVRSLRSQLERLDAGDPKAELAAVSLAPSVREAGVPGGGGRRVPARAAPARGARRPAADSAGARPAPRRRRTPRRPRGRAARGGGPARLQRRLRSGRGGTPPARDRAGRARDARGALRGLPLAAGAGQGRAAQPAHGRGGPRAPWCWCSRTDTGCASSGSRDRSTASSRSCPRSCSARSSA